MSLNFNPTKFDVHVAYSRLVDAFDVRADNAVDHEAAQEMASRGRIANSVVTQDFVFLDGRSGALAQTLGSEEHDPLICVDILGFNYRGLSLAEQAEFRAEALRRNLPSKNQGYRRLSTEADIVVTIEGLIRLNRSKKDVELLLRDSVGASRFTRLYDVANNTVVQQKIAQAREIMRTEHVSDTEAARRVGLASPKGIVSTDRMHTGRAFNALRKKQAAVKKAITAVRNYADSRVRMLRDGQVSGKVVDQLIGAEQRDVNNLVKVHKSASERVGKELSNYIPDYHVR